MKLKIENTGTEKFPFYQLIDENRNEFCATHNLENAEKIVKLFAISVVNNRRKLLSNFADYVSKKYVLNIDIDDVDVDEFLKIAL